MTFFIKISVKGCITLCFIMIFFQILFIQGIQNWNPRPWYAYLITYNVFIIILNHRKKIYYYPGFSQAPSTLYIYFVVPGPLKNNSS